MLVGEPGRLSTRRNSKREKPETHTKHKEIQRSIAPRGSKEYPGPKWAGNSQKGIVGVSIILFWGKKGKNHVEAFRTRPLLKAGVQGKTIPRKPSGKQGSLPEESNFLKYRGKEGEQ